MYAHKFIYLVQHSILIPKLTFQIGFNNSSNRNASNRLGTAIYAGWNKTDEDPIETNGECPKLKSNQQRWNVA